MNRSELIGLALVVVVLVGTPTAVFAGQRYLNSPPHEYTIIAHTVEDGGFVPRETTVRQGEHVKLRFTSADVSHGVMISGLNVEVPDIYPGKYVTVEFTPTKTGRFRIVCTVTCSARHNEMLGAVIVVPADTTPPVTGR